MFYNRNIHIKFRRSIVRKCTQLASLLMTGLFIFSLSACNKESADTSVATPTASNSAQNDISLDSIKIAKL